MRKLGFSLAAVAGWLLVALPVAYGAPPTVQQIRSIEAATAEHFGHLDAGEFAKAHAAFVKPVRDRMPLAKFESIFKSYIQQYGEPQTRTIDGYDWQLGATNVGTKTAVLVRYSGVAPKGQKFCGYLVFLEFRQAKFQLYKEDRTYFSEAEIANATDHFRRQLLGRPGCQRFLQ